MFNKKCFLKNFVIFTGKHLCHVNFIDLFRLWHKGFPVNFERFFRTRFLRNTSGWLLLFYNSCWVYTLQSYIAGNFQVVKSHLVGKKTSSIYFKDFTDLDFLIHRYFFFHFLLRKAYAVLWVAKRFVGSETPKLSAFDQFRKFEFHFKHFPRKTRYLSFNGRTDYLYLCENDRQIFSRPGEHPLSHLKVIKMWFGPNIKYLSELFFADFCCWEGISCLTFTFLKHESPGTTFFWV